MAIPHSLHEISMNVFEDVMHVFEGQRSMNKLVAKSFVRQFKIQA